MPEGQRGPVHHRRGTPLWLPRCGAGYAKPTTIFGVPPRCRTRSSFRAQHPVIPKRSPCHSERSEESRRGARGLGVWCAWRTPLRTGAATRACPYGVRLAYSVIPSGARNLGVLRDVWRLGALGVPHPAPGQPQGRAPTGCDWRVARLAAVAVVAEDFFFVFGGELDAAGQDHGADALGGFCLSFFTALDESFFASCDKAFF